MDKGLPGGDTETAAGKVEVGFTARRLHSTGRESEKDGRGLKTSASWPLFLAPLSLSPGVIVWIRLLIEGLVSSPWPYWEMVET